MSIRTDYSSQLISYFDLCFEVTVTTKEAGKDQEMLEKLQKWGGAAKKQVSLV